MTRINSRKIFAWSGAVALAALVAGAAVPAAANHVIINQVDVDFDLQTISIIGEDFDGSRLSVHLGGEDITPRCTDTTLPTANLIVCDYSDGLPADGDYLLTVARSNGKSGKSGKSNKSDKSGKGHGHGDEYDLTIGAGPQGEQGKLGDTGAQGDPGRQGVQGKLGNTGAQGPQGKLGDTGDQGPQGKLGDTGVQGPQGKIGPIGPAGPAGGITDSGRSGLAANLVAGDNFVMGSSFVASATGKCIVNITANTETEAADSFTGAFVRTARRVGAALPSHDDVYGAYSMPIGRNRSTAVSAQYVWNVVAGQSYTFGYFMSASGDFVGNVARGRVTWACFG